MTPVMNAITGSKSNKEKKMNIKAKIIKKHDLSACRHRRDKTCTLVSDKARHKPVLVAILDMMLFKKCAFAHTRQSISA